VSTELHEVWRKQQCRHSNTYQKVNRAINSSVFVLLIVFFREQRCLRLSTGLLDCWQWFPLSSGCLGLSTSFLGCRQCFASGRVWVCLRVHFWSEFKVSSFSYFHRLYGYIKKVISPYWLYHILDYFNKISLLFCPEDIGNCRTLLNLCSRFLPFVSLFVQLKTILWCCCPLLQGIPTSGIKAFRVRQKFRSVEANQPGDCLQFRLEVKIWSFLFEFDLLIIFCITLRRWLEIVNPRWN